jgi:hypothetical protein
MIFWRFESAAGKSAPAAVWRGGPRWVASTPELVAGDVGVIVGVEFIGIRMRFGRGRKMTRRIISQNLFPIPNAVGWKRCPLLL